MFSKELQLIKPKRYRDHRGFFAEIYNIKTFQELNISVNFVQDNHSLSNEVKTLRGLHYQKPPHAQSKLVRCGQGTIFDVAVDIRINSPTFGKWAGYKLSASNGHQLYIPIGFAHGFVTLEPHSEIVYKCSDYYAPETESALFWNDPDIGIKWPFKGNPVLSKKDEVAPLLKNMNSPFTWNYKI